jgi:naphthalene 1,2-dioxygenase system ferredoxin subunit
VRNGRPTCEPAVEPVRSYPVKIEGQRVFVRID